MTAWKKANDGTENGETRGMEVLVVTVGILAGPHSSHQDENGLRFIGLLNSDLDWICRQGRSSGGNWSLAVWKVTVAMVAVVVAVSGQETSIWWIIDDLAVKEVGEGREGRETIKSGCNLKEERTDLLIIDWLLDIIQKPVNDQ